MTSRIFASIAAALILAACSDEDEIDAASAAILKHMPRGSAFSQAVSRIQTLGFTCAEGQLEFVDAKGQVQRGQPHHRCQREEPFIGVCTKRTSAILIQRDGHLVNVLVNVGRFC